MSSTIEKKNSFNKNFIYDIFYNYQGKLIIIMPHVIHPPDIKFIHSTKKPPGTFKLSRCPDKHIFIYKSRLETQYKTYFELIINDDERFNVKVNKYPEFKDEILMSTMVYNEDNYIRQWINFHLNLGVTRFIIYDNSKVVNESLSYKSIEKTSNLKKVLSDFIEKEIVLLIDWPYPKRLKSTISNDLTLSGQTSAQNHSIQAFKNSKYIGLFDIDEYVNIQTPDSNINDFFDNLIKDYKININKTGCFVLNEKKFYNPDDLPTDDYNFLKIYTCDPITQQGQEKNFVIPKNCHMFAVHLLHYGEPARKIPNNRIYFNHYYYLNKPGRGREKRGSKDTSIQKHTNFIPESK